MSGYKSWAAKQRGNPILLAVAAFGILGGCFLGYNQIIQPYFRRRRLAQAEVYGNFVYEQELKRRNQ